ncbi:MAG: hypothetical protein GWO41_10280 [candidate division Zixibacteria bacterium]|nr:hypothetical protein [candidate division Zixibacteria bacterium]NIR64593.1 hypothetical protein [candidate division Zixibacteria bacterium]NIS16716.1 hypothetical protein [candidate division Zixibacteria bacterium]NIS46451.1 hypothetical protein [candidate division Zixibacteria bacterium]NIT53105.1 hypothetical protein [candidate division Zixibacteria bacterium]
MNFWKALLAIDRRWIFLFVFLALAVPMFLNVDFELSISREVQGLYDALDKLQPNSKVLMSFDYDPPSAPELQPMADAIMKYCLKKRLRIIIMGLWPQGPIQANMALNRAFAEDDIDESEYVYGIHYVNLGYQAGNEFVIQRMGSSFYDMFKNDYAGNRYEELPLMRGIKNFNDIDFSINFSAGYPGTVEWVQIAVDRFHVRLGAGNTAVQAPQVYPYYNSGQIVGLAGGMRGAAELEGVFAKGDGGRVEYKDKGTKYMFSQTIAHAVVMFFIVVGNIAYFVIGRKDKLKASR